MSREDQKSKVVAVVGGIPPTISAYAVAASDILIADRITAPSEIDVDARLEELAWYDDPIGDPDPYEPPCPFCGLTEHYYEGYGLAGGGLGSYAGCDACGYWSKVPDVEDMEIGRKPVEKIPTARHIRRAHVKYALAQRRAQKYVPFRQR